MTVVEKCVKLNKRENSVRVLGVTAKVGAHIMQGSLYVFPNFLIF